MKKALAIVLATACLIPAHALAEADLTAESTISDYVDRICGITH